MRFVFLILCTFILLPAVGQNYGSCQHDKIVRARNNGDGFREVVLFSKTQHGADTSLRRYQVYKPLYSSINMLHSSKPSAINITLYTADNKKYTLELTESHPVMSGAEIGYINEDGRHASHYGTGLHYSGALKGLKKSVAAMSVFENGEVMLFFSCDDGNFIMGKIRDGSGDYILYNTQDRLFEIPVTCHVMDSSAAPVNNRAASKATGPIECRKLRVYWEVGYDIYQALGSIPATQNYLAGVFNFMQSIYYNDGIAVEMSSMYIWTVADPFTRSHPSDALFHFQRYWYSQNYTFYADEAHLIIDGNGWQGYGTITGLCQNGAFAVSNIIGSQLGNYPVFDVDIYLVSHETGHNIGSQHTQWCGWNTGPGGTCGAIDNCTIQETWGTGCSSCPYKNDANATGFKGTIMSYCGARIDFSAGFGPEVGAFLRNKINSSSCLRSVINPELVVKDICSGDGTVTITYPPSNFGVAPYKYLWSNNKQTKDINNLSTPGKYHVTITDSNNCTTSDTAEIKELAKPGDGLSLQGSMPYCCKDTSFKVTITTTLPAKLSSCQAVGWLRTKQPVNSYTDAKLAYANATQTDLLMSDNDSLIDNNTRAMLTIQSPAKCDTVTAYYYTPFIIRRPLAKKVYTINAGNQVIIKNPPADLGYSIVFPAQPGLPTLCEKNGQLVTDTITVTIGSYTGRANHLTIRVISADNKELFHKTDYPGNGIYKIPVTGIGDHFQAMTLKAYDFNCSTGTNCTGCSFTIQAVKEVTYDSLPPLTFDSSCVVGKSVYLSFGPDSCGLNITNTVVQELVNIFLYPNPAGSDTYLAFNAPRAGKCNIEILDMAGRVLSEEKIAYGRGLFRKAIRTSGLSAGVYFVRLKSGNGHIHSLKLVIQ